MHYLILRYESGVTAGFSSLFLRSSPVSPFGIGTGQGEACSCSWTAGGCARPGVYAILSMVDINVTSDLSNSPDRVAVVNPLFKPLHQSTAPPSVAHFSAWSLEKTAEASSPGLPSRRGRSDPGRRSGLVGNWISFAVMEEGRDYYLVRKGDMVGVYKSLSDCQAQICSSVSGPAASAYKGHSWSTGKEEYLSAHGLSNATYVINAAELREDILGPLVPCSYQEIMDSSSNQLAPNYLGFHNGIASQTGPQSVDLNHEARSGSSSHISLANFRHSGAVDAQPISKQYMIGILHFDGASKGNPGKAGAGAVLLTEDGRVISRLREGLGVVTNNVAEYRGLILGLKYAIRHGFKRIKVLGDSQLVCNQVNGVWQTKHQNMMELCNEVRRLKENFHSFEINHVRREWNAEADRQANIGITLASGAVSEERGDF